MNNLKWNKCILLRIILLSHIFLVFYIIKFQEALLNTQHYTFLEFIKYVFFAYHLLMISVVL